MAEPTPEQITQIRQGCFYEFCRIVATILCALILLYLVPMFGASINQIFMVVVSWLGLYTFASYIMRLFYPDRPLIRIMEEIESEK